MDRPTTSRGALLAFINGETAGGLVLMVAAALALVVANGPWAAD